MEENQGLEANQENQIAGKKAVKKVVKELLSEESNSEKVLVIRHDKPKQELLLRDRLLFTAEGVIDTVYRYLNKRVGLIDQLQTTVLVNREEMTIKIHSNETDHWGDKLQGKIDIHPDFIKFGINSGKQLSTQAMGDFFKMHRAFFVSRELNLELVTILKRFEANVTTAIAEIKENNGNSKNLRENVVSSNIPAGFQLKMCLFKGLAPQVFDVETKIIVSPSGEILCSLESPHAQELIESYKNEVFDEQIELIATVAPDVLIIEQ